MNPPYVINDGINLFAYEARAFYRINHYGGPTPMWLMGVYERITSPDDDGEHSTMKISYAPVGPQGMVRGYVADLNPRPDLTAELINLRNWKPLSGASWLYQYGSNYMYLPCLAPLVNETGDPDTDTLLKRIAARLDRPQPLSETDLLEARKAVPAALINDPVTLAAALAGVPPHVAAPVPGT